MAKPSDGDSESADTAFESVRNAAVDREVSEIRAELAALRTELAHLTQTLREARIQAADAEASLPDAPVNPADAPHIDGVMSPPDTPRGTVTDGRTNVTRALERLRQFRAMWRSGGVGTEVASATVPSREVLNRRWEIGLVLVVVTVAAYLRLHDLTASPPGLHGDEGVWGIEAQRILREGWIGPYSLTTAGTPTGTFYLAAPAVWAFGNTIFAVRVVPALTAMLTVFALYAVLRSSFGPHVALAGSALLAVMSWHVHFARIGYSVGTWPLVTILATATLVKAIQSHDWRWWGATGGLLGLGVYTYNAHLLFVGLVGAFALVWLTRWDAVVPLAGLALYAYRPNLLTLAVLAVSVIYLLNSRWFQSRERVMPLVILAITLLAIALPMIHFAADPHSGYFNQQRAVSVFNKDEWTSLDGAGAQIRYLGGQYFHYWERLCCRPRLDGIDATGVVPEVPLTMLVLAAAGVVLGVWRRRGPLVYFGVLVVLAMPLGAALTQDVVMRRSFAIAPFLAMFSAIAVVEMLRIAGRQTAGRKLQIVAVLVMLTGVAVYRNLEYTEITARSLEYRWVFTEELTDATLFMRTLPADSHVYFYSNRWGEGYPTRVYLAPDVSIEDRSFEFGAEEVRGSLDIDPTQGKPIFVLVGHYKDFLDEIRDRYPGGQVVSDGSDAEPTFLAYLPPEALDESLE